MPTWFFFVFSAVCTQVALACVVTHDYVGAASFVAAALALLIPGLVIARANKLHADLRVIHDWCLAAEPGRRSYRIDNKSGVELRDENALYMFTSVLHAARQIKHPRGLEATGRRFNG